MPLPVVLINFEVRRNKDKLKLEWQTSQETNNKEFVIQRSQDLRNWDNLSFVIGNGYSEKVHYYEYEDKDPFDGINYYLLKQIDFDGSYEFSNVISAYLSKQEEPIRIYPNPTSDILYISNPPEESMVHIKSIEGKLILSKKLIANQIDIEQLQTGQYILSLSNAKKNKSIFFQKL